MKSFTKKILRHFNLEVKRINPNYRSVESTDTYFGLLAKTLSDHQDHLDPRCGCKHRKLGIAAY